MIIYFDNTLGERLMSLVLFTVCFLINSFEVMQPCLLGCGFAQRIEQLSRYISKCNMVNKIAI